MYRVTGSHRCLGARCSLCQTFGRLEAPVKKHVWVMLSSVIALAAATILAQAEKYPVIVIPTGKGPYTFPAGYQTPWEKVEIFVTEKMSPNLFILHGSQGIDAAHPDASGRRVIELFGAAGVLMVDTQNRQVADKTLKAIRTFTNAPIKAIVNSHIHGDHTGANAFFGKEGGVIFAQDNLRAEMVRPSGRAGGPAAAGPDPAGVPVATYSYNPAAPGPPAVTPNIDAGTAEV